MKKSIQYIFAGIIGGIISLGVYKLNDSVQDTKLILPDTGAVKYLEPAAVRFVSNTSSPQQGSIDFTVAAEKSINTVVHIKTLYKGQEYYYNDPFYDFLWGGKNYQKFQTPSQIVSGSGVILTADGYIVTNNHVIQNSDEVEVSLNSRKSYKATIVGVDLSTDLALLKIDAKDLPYVSYGNSDEVRVGEWVLAVGNPYNLTSTVTAGIVSAKGRNIDILRDKFKIESFIQTDAAVNPGNSGGALVNTNGLLIGITTAIASQTGSFTGYSFAIPVNIVKKVVNDLIEFGEVQRGFIGVSIDNMDTQSSVKNNMMEYNGVYVQGVAENGAAKKAGIKPGDIITTVGNVKVTSVPELQEQVGLYRPGDKIYVSLYRENKLLSLPVILTNIQGTTTISKRKN